MQLVRNVLEMPLRTIAENAGQDGAVVAAKVRKGTDASFGYDALNDQYGDMFKFGIVDPAKVVRTALQNALSVATLLMTTDSIIVEAPKEPEAAGGHHDHDHGMGGMGGGMGDMMGGMM